ncbi:MAG TPA: serine O-acetyltransferase [Xanthobacteraceae bacterium]|jgi:serine O-acetyltransferase
MAQRQAKFAQGVRTLDPVWARVREEAEAAAAREPQLASFIFETILNHDSLERAVAHRIAARLDHPDVSGDMIRQAYDELIEAEPSTGEAIRADIGAVVDRDPACSRAIEPVLYFKGFHALQTHRLAHFLWKRGRQDFALYLQSRSSSVFGVDINPATKIGRGIFIDHATGVVIGQTAVIDDDVSIMQGVTLGGTGKERGDRHPKIRRGVLISAGAKILGNIEIGSCARVAAGSVVLKPVAPNTTVAGIPARVVGSSNCDDEAPARTMDQMFDLPFSGEGI